MSNNIFSQQGVIRLMDYVSAGVGFNWQIGLFVNNATPTWNWTMASIVEASFTGYTRVITNWGTAGAFGQGGFFSIGGRSFVCTGAGPVQNVYGYFVQDVSTGDLIWAERFDSAPFPVQNVGDTVAFIPQWNGVSQFLM